MGSYLVLIHLHHFNYQGVFYAEGIYAEVAANVEKIVLYCTRMQIELAILPSCEL